MKKFMLVAAVSAAAVLPACGDDSSSSPSGPSCTVSVNGNTVVQTDTVPYYGSYTTTYTVEGDSVKIEYSAEPEQNVVTPLYGRTLDYYAKQAEDDCKDFYTNE